MIGVILLLILLQAFGQEIPDYDDPYSPIIFNKQVYTWTDKVLITIIAPSWNADTGKIDSIGSEPSHAIKITTGDYTLKNYKLTETAPNNGIFEGKITLTGFLHDANGDGSDDTNPRTSGTGPTNGFLQVERGDGITLSFEFAENIILTKSVLVDWNIGTVKFDKTSYLDSDNAKIRIVDFDMNLNPELLDRIQVQITSDSDLAGIVIDAIETDDATGIFEGTLSFDDDSASSGNRLFAVTGDSIFAKYSDHTLPLPYSITDDLDIKAQAKLESSFPQLERVTLDNPYLADRSGNTLDNLVVNESYQIVGTLRNNQSHDQDFVYLIQIRNSGGAPVSLSWIQGSLASQQSFQVSQSWTPEISDTYVVESFIWDSIKNSVALSPSTKISYFIN